jgi:hypothetical protein
MRLRLLERLRRLARRRFGSQAQDRGREGSRPRGDAGRHRSGARLPPGPAGPGVDGPVQPPARQARQQGGPARQAAARQPSPASSAWPADGRAGDASPPAPRNYAPPPARAGTGPGGAGRARIRPAGWYPHEQEGETPGAAPPRQPWYHVVGGPPARQRQAPAEARPREPAALAGAAVAQAAGATRVAPADAMRAARDARRAAMPFAPPHAQGHPPAADGRRNCGPLEKILWRQWDAATVPPPEAITAIDRLAELPRQLQERLAAGLDGIYVGAGGVPDLDDMGALHGIALPSGRATWDACAGAYGERKIVVGSRPSPTPDVMCHEVGHALDDLDSPPGKWQSDSAEFRMICDQCQPYIASDFHRQRGGLGRKEFFADAFAAIASAQRPALVDMLSGNTRAALRVMLYFNKRYGI